MLPFAGATGQNRYIFLKYQYWFIAGDLKDFPSPNRQFWEGEVSKTNGLYIYNSSQKVSSSLLLSRSHCRPLAWRHYWKDHIPVHSLSFLVGWPLYVCDSRYNDRDRIFVSIKNWNSCVPEEVRKSEEFVYSSGPFFLDDSGVCLSEGGHWKVLAGLGMIW